MIETRSLGLALALAAVAACGGGPASTTATTAPAANPARATDDAVPGPCGDGAAEVFGCDLAGGSVHVCTLTGGPRVLSVRLYRGRTQFEQSASGDEMPRTFALYGNGLAFTRDGIDWFVASDQTGGVRSRRTGTKAEAESIECISAARGTLADLDGWLESTAEEYRF